MADVPGKHELRSAASTMAHFGVNKSTRPNHVDIICVSEN